MEKSEEILCRAAIVKTLTQLENISYVDININNKPLKNQNGEEVGLLSPGNFIESDDTSMVTKHTITLMLYYTNEEGNALIETNRQILYDNSLSLENLVINELISGPNTEDLYPTLPSTLKVLSVSTKDGICYVNLDSSFVTDALDVSEYVPIYSIVNSLVELSGITKVQISVNGSFDLVFKEKIPLTQIFEWNSDYLGGDYH
jgi:germination protein M